MKNSALKTLTTASIHKTFSVAMTATLVSAMTLIMSNPTLAAIFKIGFCGQFEPAPGGVLPGSFIEIDTDVPENFGIIDAKIMTTRDQPGDQLTYLFSDFQVSGQGNDLEGDPFMEESVYWRFFDTEGNNANIVMKLVDWQSLIDNNPEFPFIMYDISEKRLGETQFVKDKDKGQPIPEPSSIFGLSLVLGLGALAKVQQSKQQN